MQVTVKLFGALRQFLPAGSGFNSCQLTTTENSMLEDVLGMLKFNVLPFTFSIEPVDNPSSVITLPFNRS